MDVLDQLLQAVGHIQKHLSGLQVDLLFLDGQGHLRVTAEAGQGVVEFVGQQLRKEAHAELPVDGHH